MSTPGADRCLIEVERPVVTRARYLTCGPCPIPVAVRGVRDWHSRLPRVQSGPWMFAFAATYEGWPFAVALWHNPSARTLPRDWIELRRMACAPDAPRYTASRLLSYCVRWFKRWRPEFTKAISYQDPAVHLGTIYRAAGWNVDHKAKDRTRDRSQPRRGTSRSYRSNLNGQEVDSIGKIRWAVNLQ